MDVVECIYRRLFDADSSAAEQLDPVTITSQILESYDKCECGESYSLLLWLSIIRKVFSVSVETGVPISAPTGISIPISAGLDPVPISSSVVGDEDLKAVQQTLLGTTTFVPALIACFTSGDQLVCYAASRALHQTMVASQWIEEGWVAELFPLISNPSHECFYSLQFFKQLLKSTRKTEREGNCVGFYQSILSYWKEHFTELSSKLKTKATKWPELNFVSFLSLSVELLRYTNLTASHVESVCVQMIGGNLECLTSAVAQHCGSAISLKGLLKLYSTFIGTSTGSDQGRAKQLEASLPTLLSSPGLSGAVSAVLQEVRKDGSSDYVVVTGSTRGLSRLVVRKTVLFLMKYGSLLEEKGAILSFEASLRSFSRQCGLQLPCGTPDDLTSLRRSLFQIMNEQDDDILDMLTASCKLWKKQTLWTAFPVLRFCFSLTNLHSLVLEFLLSLSYDHSILLDFIMSPETHKFNQFLVEYLEVCCVDWSGLTTSCQEIDRHDTDRTELWRVGATVPQGPKKCHGSSSSTDHEEQELYRENTLDRFVDCLIRFKYSLMRLSASHLLPVPVDELLSVLSQAEDIYENS